jgi:prolyl oligopeptidase
MWRHVKYGVLAVVLFGSAPIEITSAGDVSYPETKRETVTETYHAVVVSDPYRWLECACSQEVADWLDRENAITDAYLHDTPQWLAIAERLKVLTKVRSKEYAGFRHVGGPSFVLYKDPTVHQTSVLASLQEVDLATLHVVVDPRCVGDAGCRQSSQAIDWYVPSPDGRKVAVSLSSDGSEAGTLHEFDVATGNEVDRPIARVQFATGGGSLAWRRDGQGFWYTRYPENSQFNMRVYYHNLGTDPADDPLVLGSDFPKIAEVKLDNGDGTAPLVVSVANGDGGDFEHFVIPESGSPFRITRFEDQVGAVVGAPDGTLLVISYREAPHGKLLVLDGGKYSLAEARTLVPEGDRIFRPQQELEPRPLVITADRIYAQVVNGGPVDVAAFDRSGKFVRTLPGPTVAALGPVVPVGGGKVVYGVTTFLDPFRYMLFDEVASSAVETGLAQTRDFDFSDSMVTRDFATASDGTRIPVTIISRKDVKQDGTAPLLVWGYGGYGTIQSPTNLLPATRIWLDAGGVYALANVRGGGEYGPEWHKAGYLTHKQRVFDDFTAVVRHLVDAKWGAPDRVALRGGSNGGLLMGAMIVQHPELARAVLSEVGIYDTLREEDFPNGAFNVTEFGSVKDPEQFRALYSYSPYHHVKKGAEYPAVFLTADADDDRVNPMQSRKMAAALQWATSGTTPILLHTTAGIGHGISIPVDAGIAAKAATYAFLFRELGMTVVAPPR